MCTRRPANSPREEVFALAAQMRRAAISVPANIVEGSFRTGEGEYVNFLNITLGSAAELGYHLSVAYRLGYLSKTEFDKLSEEHTRCIKSLQALVSSYRKYR